MKNTIRLFALTLACVMLCVPLMGCDKMIRDMEKTTAYELENGNLSFNGEEYILLPEGDYSLHADNYLGYVCIVPEGTPLLIKDPILPYTASIYDDGIFILHYETDTKRYCRADFYDSLTLQIENGIEYTTYGYHYYIRTDPAPRKSYTYTLTQEQVDTIEYILSTIVPEEYYPVFDDYAQQIYKYSEDNMFVESVAEILKIDEYYCLKIDSENDEDELIYPVPASMNPVFDEIMKNSIENHK